MAVANQKKRSKKGALVVVGVVLVGILAGAPILMGMTSNSVSNYTAYTSTKETIETYYTYTGSVASSNTQNIMAQGIMQISEILVQEGDQVNTESVLFKTTNGEEIKSEISGTVNKIAVEPDKQVMSGTLLAEIIDFENLEIAVKVDEYDINSVEVDKKIEVSINALDKDIEGTVSEISRTAISQNGVSYFTAIVKLEKDNEIKVGMTAEAKILKEQAKDAVVIPMNALSFDDNNSPYVYVKDVNNKMVKTSVVTGINNGKSVQVEDGLSSGQTVYKLNENIASNGMMPPMGGERFEE